MHVKRKEPGSEIVTVQAPQSRRERVDALHGPCSTARGGTAERNDRTIVLRLEYGTDEAKGKRVCRGRFC